MTCTCRPRRSRGHLRGAPGSAPHPLPSAGCTARCRAYHTSPGGRAALPARLLRPVLACAFAALLAGCASDTAAWVVPSGSQERFERAKEACEMLTDGPEAFDRCLKRRGWRRERWYERMF